MTRPRELVHRPGCDGPTKPPEKVGPWRVTRCRGCGAVGLEAADEIPTERQENQK